MITNRWDGVKAARALGAVGIILVGIAGAQGCSSGVSATAVEGARSGSGGHLPPIEVPGGASGTAGTSGGAGSDGAVASADIAGCAPIALPPGVDLDGIWIGPAGEVWVAGAGGIVGRRTPDAAGGVWSWCQPGSSSNLRAIWGAAGNDVWAVGDAATILRWNGATWTTVTSVGSPPVGNLWDVWGEASTVTLPHPVWIVGDAGAVRSFDGFVWHVADAPAQYTLNSVWGSPSGVLRVSGSNPRPPVANVPGQDAVVLRRNADGSWAREAVFSQDHGGALFASIRGDSDTDIWASGVRNPSGAAISYATAAHFDGATWSLQAGQGTAAAPDDIIAGRIFTDIAVSPPDAPSGAWFTDASREGRPAVRFDGTTWRAPDPIASGLQGIDVRGASMWAAGFNGKVVRWTPGGWVISNPELPAGP
jgi:hypothetical protein